MSYTTHGGAHSKIGQSITNCLEIERSILKISFKSSMHGVEVESTFSVGTNTTWMHCRGKLMEGD